MKKLYFLDEQEKNRILNLHTEATKKQYLVKKDILNEAVPPKDVFNNLLNFFKKVSSAGDDVLINTNSKNRYFMTALDDVLDGLDAKYIHSVGGGSEKYLYDATKSKAFKIDELQRIIDSLPNDKKLTADEFQKVTEALPTTIISTKGGIIHQFRNDVIDKYIAKFGDPRTGMNKLLGKLPNKFPGVAIPYRKVIGSTLIVGGTLWALGSRWWWNADYNSLVYKLDDSIKKQCNQFTNAQPINMTNSQIKDAAQEIANLSTSIGIVNFDVQKFKNILNGLGNQVNFCKVNQKFNTMYNGTYSGSYSPLVNYLSSFTTSTIFGVGHWKKEFINYFVVPINNLIYNSDVEATEEAAEENLLVTKGNEWKKLETEYTQFKEERCKCLYQEYKKYFMNPNTTVDSNGGNLSGWVWVESDKDKTAKAYTCDQTKSYSPVYKGKPEVSKLLNQTIYKYQEPPLQWTCKSGKIEEKS